VLAISMRDETHQFDERRASLESQVSVLTSRIDQLTTEIGGIDIERDATERQVGYIKDELVNLRHLASKALVPMTRVFAMEREESRLQGVIGRLIADKAKAQSEIGEMNIHTQQLRENFQEEVATSLLDVRQKIASARQSVAVAQDVLNRIELVAPRSGTVQNLKVYTLGQVIRPGEALLEVVPDDEQLVIHAQFSPTDIDGVHAGQQAEIRFPTFHSRQIPLMMGRLDSISNDRMLDEQSRQYYFLGVISLNRSDIPDEYRSRIRSGMPAEVIVELGDRTVLSYFVSPLAGAVRKAFREE
jgi:HlyD family secretion protein